ncbi:MAG TPA: hypothetical protein PLE42_04980 [Candidatus Competibacteraceae bacterium]|nr:hypothetical protein [Candidatus Competibacteraceae bacterium]
MPRYIVDAKAFISLEVDADDPAAARLVAEAFIENGMMVFPATVAGYNAGLDNPVGTVVPSEIAPMVDGLADVTEIT